MVTPSGERGTVWMVDPGGIRHPFRETCVGLGCTAMTNVMVEEALADVLAIADSLDRKTAMGPKMQASDLRDAVGRIRTAVAVVGSSTVTPPCMCHGRTVCPCPPVVASTPKDGVR